MKIKESIKRITAAGFPYIKVELEAEVDYFNHEEEECQNCDATGHIECSVCEGQGTITEDATDPANTTFDCDECRGEGHVDCYICDGSGQEQVEHSDAELVEDLGVQVEHVFRHYLREHYPNITNPLPYFRAYVDGSVNTEITFTIDTRCAEVLPDFLTAFHDECNAAGGYETENAGLHLTLLPEATYPSEHRLPERQIDAFKTAMNTFVPYLYALATNGDTWTRSLYYREAYCSSEHKYSAIFTHNDRCIEYRIFDTCYDNPEHILSFIGVMARSLKFYTDGLKTADINLIREVNQGPNVQFGGDPGGITYMYNQVPNRIVQKVLSRFCSRAVQKVVNPLLMKGTVTDKQEALRQLVQVI